MPVTSLAGSSEYNAAALTGGLWKGGASAPPPSPSPISQLTDPPSPRQPTGRGAGGEGMAGKGGAEQAAEKP
jgi:hypothetical protein